MRKCLRLLLHHHSNIFLLLSFHKFSWQETILKTIYCRTLWNTIYNNIKHLSSNYIDHFWQQATLQTTNFGQSSFTLTIPSKTPQRHPPKPHFLQLCNPHTPVIRVTSHGEIHEISWQYIVHVTETLSWYKGNYTQFSLPEEFRNSFFKSKTSDLNLYTFKTKWPSLLKTPIVFGQFFFKFTSQSFSMSAPWMNPRKASFWMVLPPRSPAAPGRWLN